jgi:hypothetical protein
VEQVVVPKTQQFKDLQRVALTEGLPVLWGAVQWLIQQVEALSNVQPQPSPAGQPQPAGPQPQPSGPGQKRWQ